MELIAAKSIEAINTYSLQSANVFLHCMRRKKYLKSILLNHAFIPRYNIENIDYLHLKGYDRIAIPMTCFCDIFLNRLYPHMKNYGHYGIGLKKNSLIKNGLTPISYVNPISFFTRDLSHTVQIAFDQLDGEDSDLYNEDFLNYQIHQLMYIKPLSGKMCIHKKIKDMNFHDECEWRYIPDMRCTDLWPLIINKDILLDKKQLNFYNTALAEYQAGWYKFSYDDIKYIIVDKEKNRNEFIDFILNQLDITEMDKYRMISKIMTYEDLEGDF